MRKPYAALLRKERSAVAIEDYYSPLFVSSAAQSADAFGDAVSESGEPREILGYIGKPGSSAAVLAAQKGISITGKLFAPIDCGVKAFDVVTEPESGNRFQVVNNPRNAAKRGHHLEFDLISWRGGAKSAD